MGMPVAKIGVPNKINQPPIAFKQGWPNPARTGIFDETWIIRTNRPKQTAGSDGVHKAGRPLRPKKTLVPYRGVHQGPN